MSRFDRARQQGEWAFDRVLWGRRPAYRFVAAITSTDGRGRPAGAKRRHRMSFAPADPLEPVDVVERWQRAGEALDSAAAAACLADDVVVISPLTAAFRFRGRARAQEMLHAAFDVIDAIEYHTVVTDPDGRTRALFYRGRCGRQEFEEAQLLRLDAEDRIAEVTLFGRPLPGLTAVMARIGPELVREHRPALAVLFTLATRPLAALTALGERRLVPLADPDRRGRKDRTSGTTR